MDSPPPTIESPSLPGPEADCHDASEVARRHAGPLVCVVIAGVWLYRATLGPFLGGHCRYLPTCSEYMLLAVRKHGAVRGTFMGLCRILRCHPWHPGGVDYP